MVGWRPRDETETMIMNSWLSLSRAATAANTSVTTAAATAANAATASVRQGARKLAKSAALLSALGLVAAAILNPAQAELLDDIQAKGKIVIGTEGVYAPYTYHDEQNNLTGYDVEVGRAIAAELGVKAEFVESPWDSLIAGLDAKRYDVVINQVGSTPDRRQKFDFSQPYTSVKGVLLVNQKNNELTSLEQLKGHKVATTITSNWGQIVTGLGGEIVGVQGFDQAVQLVASGRAEATVNSEIAWNDYLSVKPNVPVKVVDRTKESLNSEIPFHKGNPKFAAAIDQAINKLRDDGTLSELSLKFLHVDLSGKEVDSQAEAK